MNRDGAVERLLRSSRLGVAEAHGSSSCPDAEALAAWTVGSLAGERGTAVEAHLSSCGRCLAIVAAMARAAPPAEPVARPWTRMRRVGSRVGGRVWGGVPDGWTTRTVRWVAPLSAAAAAVVLWLAVPSNRPAPPRPVENGSVPTVAPAAPLASADSRPDAGSSPPALASKPVAPAPAVGREERRAEAEALASSPPQAPAESEAVTVPPEAPAGDAQTTARVAPLAEGARLRQAAQPPATAVAATDIVSPDPSIRWRLGPRGFVQYSSDGGSSWVSQPTGVDASLAAGAAPSSTVCWLVGQSGSVLLSTDGRTWRRLAFPEPLDLIAVRATDARAATVMGADGRSFRTGDGGATWTRLVQEN